MNPENLHVFTDMLKTCGALKTVAARHMGFRRNPIPFFEMGHILPDLHDFGGILVTEEEGKLDPRRGKLTPLVDMDIGSTNGSDMNPHQ